MVESNIVSNDLRNRKLYYCDCKVQWFISVLSEINCVPSVCGITEETHNNTMSNWRPWSAVLKVSIKI